MEKPPISPKLQAAIDEVNKAALSAERELVDLRRMLQYLQNRFSKKPRP